MAPFGKSSTFKGKDILSVNQFSREGLETVFRVASDMAEIVNKRGTSDLLRDKLLCTIFMSRLRARTCLSKLRCSALAAGSLR